MTSTTHSLAASDRILAKMSALRAVERAKLRGLTLRQEDAERQALAGIQIQRMVGCDPTAGNTENGTGPRMVPKYDRVVEPMTDRRFAVILFVVVAVVAYIVSVIGK